MVQIENRVNDISNYYHLETERAFLNRQLKQGLTSQQAQEYLLHQQTHFLEEFVGRISRQKYHYNFDSDQGMKAIGMIRPAAAEYWDLAEKSGANSREWADAVGFSQIDEAFLANKANVVYWISPPSIDQKGFGDYGFLFVFKKRSDGQVHVKIHRFEKENISLDQSNAIMQFLSTKHALNGINTTTDPLWFLQHPLLINGVSYVEISQDIADLANSKQANFVSDKIAAQKADQFQKKVIDHPLIKSWMNDYEQDMLIAADNRVDTANQMIAISRAEKTRTAIYNLAQDLQNGFHQTKPISVYGNHSPQQELITNSIDPLLFYSQKPAMVVGGGSCPVSNGDGNKLSDGVENLLNHGILNYKTATGLTEKGYFDCPGCGTKIRSGEGIEECPNCHLTVKKHAENLNKQGKNACI